ncbi:MAG: hypothetical protein HZB49_16830, partial [Bradyrhizobium sp.]|nr:hypothetical protein [Bradyrhizobium sp.]
SFDPVAGGTGPTLKYGGATYVDAQPWAVIGVEQTSSGYQVAWFNSASSVYTIWNTDTNGNFVSRPLANASASSSALQSIEISFQQDLNHDGVIGVPGSSAPLVGQALGAVSGNDSFVFNDVSSDRLHSAQNGEGSSEWGWFDTGLNLPRVDHGIPAWNVGIVDAAQELVAAISHQDWENDGARGTATQSIGTAQGIVPQVNVHLFDLQASFLFT